MSRISATLEAKIRKDFKNRCSYCLLPQEILSSLLEIEHILATSNGGTDEESNLCLACRICNSYKSNKLKGFDAKTKQSVELFNPRTQNGKNTSSSQKITQKSKGKHLAGEPPSKPCK
jgi:5-methylcytosine-specific restriction endonuclease McrA